MTSVALRVSDSAIANDNIAGALPAMVRSAAAHLASATTAAEVLDAKAEAGLAYTAAKAASRMAKAKGAYDELMSAIFRAQADALEIEAQAKRRLADEYDAAQDRGEVRGSGINQFAASKTEAASATDIGLTHKDIHDARQVRDAEVANPGIIKATLDALVEAGEEPTKAALNREINGRLASYSGDNEWYTPAKYVEMARTVMGRIDVDPASNDHAQQTVKAAAYYTAETNGLDKDWRGTVWMNPPYSHPEIQQFTDKVLAELASGNVTEAIVLTNNSGDTGWHHALALASAARCVTRGRIRFESLTRQTGAGAMGQVFFYFGDDVERFADVFSEIGRIEVNYLGGKQ